MVRFIPRRCVRIFIVNVVRSLSAVGQSCAGHQLSCVGDGEIVLMQAILTAFYELIVHKLSLLIIIFDEQKIDGGRRKIAAGIVIGRLAHEERLLAAVSIAPAFAFLVLKGDFLHLFQILCLSFGVLMSTSFHVDLVPVGVHVTFVEFNHHLRRIFVTLLFDRIGGRDRIIATSRKSYGEKEGEHGRRD